MRAHHRPPLRSHWLIGDEARSPEALDIWRRLYNQDPDATAAAGPDWWRMLSDTFAFTDQPRLLIAERGGEPVAAWPLALRTDRGRLLRRRTLTHANGYHTYYGDPVIAADAPPHTPAVLVRAVRRAPGTDFININRIAPRLVADGKFDLVPNRILDVSCTPSHLTGRPLRELKRRRRRLDDVGHCDISRLVGPALGDLAPTFAALHTDLKRMQQQWALFAESPGSPQRFATAIVHAASALDVGAVVLSLDDEVCAAVIMAWHNGHGLQWRTVWNPDMARFGLGSLLLAEAIAWCRERGDSVLHLGPGDEPYKADWASETRYVTRWRSARNTPAAGLLRAADLIGRLRTGRREAGAS